MKHKHFPRNKSQNLVTVSRPIDNSVPKQDGLHFQPARDEVAKRAYLSYVNNGFLHGNEIGDWLKAEAELVAEHDVTQVAR